MGRFPYGPIKQQDKEN